MPLIRWDGGSKGRKVLKEQRVQQRRQFLDELRLFHEELREQPKELIKVPETSATLVDSDSEYVAEEHLPLQDTPSSMLPEGRLDMENPPSAWPWIPLNMDDTQNVVEEPNPDKVWDVILKAGPLFAIELD